MDKHFPFGPNDGCVACRLLIHLNDTNAGGSINAPFPLPRNTPFSVVAEICSETGVPLRVRVPSGVTCQVAPTHDYVLQGHANPTGPQR